MDAKGMDITSTKYFGRKVIGKSKLQHLSVIVLDV